MYPYFRNAYAVPDQRFIGWGLGWPLAAGFLGGLIGGGLIGGALAARPFYPGFGYPGFGYPGMPYGGYPYFY